jgi:vanillate O-demethylase monooxygenase subunit
LRDTILEQDRPFVESQRPGLLPPLSPRMMLYVRPIGLPLVAFQTWLEELQIPQEV